MIALAEAVIPIIRLLVAVATRSGTPMIACIVGTLTRPPPMPRSADARPATTLPTSPHPRRWMRYPGPDSVSWYDDAAGSTAAGSPPPAGADSGGGCAGSRRRAIGGAVVNRAHVKS